MTCKREAKRLEKQIMADLPHEKLAVLAPFVYTALDLLGPLTVREVARSRRSVKTWGVLYVCLGTKSCAIYACPGYDTKTFLTTHQKFTSTYGVPTKIYCDHGPALVSGATRPDWQEVNRMASLQGTQWQFTPKGCPWRNGQAERAIGMAKKTLTRILVPGVLLDFHELDSLFHRVASILNSRPIAVHTSVEGEYHSITPNDILLGRAARIRPKIELEEEDDTMAKKSLSHCEQLVRSWWKEWIKQVFPELVPRSKWKTSQRNVCVGDIVHVRYEKSFGKPAFRLARITETFPDYKGHVRTCTVALRPKRIGDSGSPTYRYKPLEELTLGVQRIAVLLPAELQGVTAQGQNDEGTLPEGSRRQSRRIGNRRKVVKDQ